MLGNLALNLSVDAGLSLVNDVMNAVSGSASSQPLTPSGNAGSGSAFGGQGGFGEILNNSIDNLSNSANNQNQSGAVQPVSSSLNNAPNAAPVSQVNQQANEGVNAGNNYAANQGGNNIGGNSADNVSSAGRPANNNTVNAGNNTNKNNNTAGNNATGDNAAATGAAAQNTGGGTAEQSTFVKDNSQKASKNADSGGNSAKQASVNNNVATGNNNGADGQAVYFVGNTNINILIQPVSIKKGDKAANGEGGAAGAGGVNVKSGDKTPLAASDALFSSSTAATLYRSQSQNSNNSYGGNSAGNPSDKTFASVLTENAGKKIADKAAAQNTGGGSAEQSVPVKIGGAADKNSENGPAQKAASVLLNAFNRSSQNNQNVQASNSNVSVKSAIINTANTKTLIKDAAVNALNLNVLIGEAKPALSGNNEGNIAGNNAGADSGSSIAGGIKTSGFMSAGFSGASISSLNGSASGGNSGGLNLSGGNIAGLDDSSGGTNAAAAINSVMFMLRKNVQSAVITLNPASLGTVKINISLNNPNSTLNSLNQSAASNGAITINMLAQNEAAKNMLRSSSDLLQNALKNQGFSSINLNISTGSGYNNQNGNGGGETLKNQFAGANYNGRFSNGTSGPDSDLVSGAVPNGVNNFTYRNPNSLVDYFV